MARNNAAAPAAKPALISGLSSVVNSVLPVGEFECEATKTSVTKSGYNLLHFNATNKDTQKVTSSVMLLQGALDLEDYADSYFDIEVIGHNNGGYPIIELVQN